jgi:hypothetical protein
MSVRDDTGGEEPGLGTLLEVLHDAGSFSTIDRRRSAQTAVAAQSRPRAGEELPAPAINAATFPHAPLPRFHTRRYAVSADSGWNARTLLTGAWRRLGSRRSARGLASGTPAFRDLRRRLFLSSYLEGSRRAACPRDPYCRQLDRTLHLHSYRRWEPRCRRWFGPSSARAAATPSPHPGGPGVPRSSNALTTLEPHEANASSAKMGGLSCRR